MKKLLLSAIMACLLANCYAQDPRAEYKLLTEKVKRQKTSSVVVGSIGLGLALAGTLVAADDVSDGIDNFLNPDPKPDKDNHSLTNGLFIASGAAIVGSILLRIAAKKNSKRARAMLSSNKVSIPPGSATNLYSAGVQISF